MYNGFMIETSITDAKAHLSSLVEAALQGEVVILGRAGKPVARIVPFHDAKKNRNPGGLEGIIVPDDFNDSDPEIVSLFEGEDLP
jgi:prevent-host-death family protein